jgi:hypothetical protein
MTNKDDYITELPPLTSNIIQIKNNEIVSVLGTAQHGKSTFVKEAIVKNVKYPIIFDYYKLYTDVANATSKFEDLMQMIKNKEFPITYNPPTRDSIFFEAFCGLVHEIGGLYVVFEEISDYVKFNYISPNFSSLINVGANQGLGMCLISTRPAHFHNDIKSRCLKVVIFKLVAYTDVEYVEKWTHIDQNLLKEIEPYHFIFINFYDQFVEYHTPVEITKRRKKIQNELERDKK